MLLAQSAVDMFRELIAYTNRAHLSSDSLSVVTFTDLLFFLLATRADIVPHEISHTISVPDNFWSRRVARLPPDFDMHKACHDRVRLWKRHHKTRRLADYSTPPLSLVVRAWKKFVNDAAYRTTYTAL